MEHSNHRRLTMQIIDSVFPDIEEVIRNCLIRASIAVDIRECIRRRREIHFYRIPYAVHETAWDIGMLEMRYRLMRYRWQYKRGKVKTSCKEVGLLIHMIENFFCHSNVFDLPEPMKQSSVTSMISLGEYPRFNGASLMFVSYGFLHRFRMRDDGYTHRKTRNSFPNEPDIEEISEAVQRFFWHYGIIV